MAYTYDHPRPAVTVDNLIFSFEEKEVQVLLVQRKLPPFKGEWALPGGFVEINESLDDAALRELREETGIDNAFIQQLKSFGEVDRDPRGRIISVAYFALVRKESVTITPGSDAQGVAWFNVNELPILAFDHDEIIDYAVEYLRDLFKYKPISFELLPDKFTLTEMQRLYEAVTNREMDKRNFRKKVLNMDILREFEGESDRVVKRMATLYTFDRNKYRKLTEEERDKITFY
jgi:8-oxo-dGTP diphosphatase